ncbi:MAG: rod shape-determining protein MreC, partial [Pseudomonadota bacterium]
MEITAIKPLFTEGPSVNTRLMAAVLASVALITMEQRNNHLDALRSVLSVIVYPVQFVASLPVEVRYTLVESVKSYSSLLTENKSLKEELLQSKSRLLKFSALEKEN